MVFGVEVVEDLTVGGAFQLEAGEFKEPRMATTQEMKDRIAALAGQMIEEFGEVDDSNALSWLDAIETRAVEIGDAVAAELVKRKSADRPAEKDESTCPQCGKLGQYQGRCERPLVTRRGLTTIAEPEYYCPCCRKAFFPDDQSDRR